MHEQSQSSKSRRSEPNRLAAETSPYLQQLLGPEVQIVDNGEAVARQTRRLLAGQLASGDGTPTSASGEVKLFTGFNDPA